MASIDAMEYQLSRLTGLAMKNKLQDLILPSPDDPTQTLTVNATYSRPEKWIEERIPPAVNVNLLGMTFDGRRQTTAKLQKYEDDTKMVMLEKDYYMPVIYFYEIRFIVAYGLHMMSLNEQIFRRLPPLGFGSFVEFEYDGVRFECPFELADDKEIFARYGETEDNREFEKVFRYKVQGWLDSNMILADPTKGDGYNRIKTISKVTVKTDTN